VSNNHLGGFLFGGKVMNSESTIENLVKQFELKTILPETFHHQEHVKIAWWYLRHYSLVESIVKFTSGLKDFARHLDKENLYHETISWAFILLINERVHKTDTLLTWDEFAKVNKDLLDWKNNVLKRYYQETTLKSELARQTFLLPDKID
jgi:hypothetical protein